MDFVQDFAGAQQDMSAALVSTIRAATRVSAEDVDFHRTSSPAVGKSVDRETARLLSLAERLLRQSITDFGVSLSGLDSLDNSWNLIVDAVDHLLERSDTCLDEFNGRFKQQIATAQPDLPDQRLRAPRKALPLRAADLPKPQLSFEHPPDNHALPPFRPLLDSKPHAAVPLEKSLSFREGDDGAQHTQQPYESEIDGYRYPSSVYTSAEPILYHPFASTQATFVEDFDGVLEMLEELKTAKEIAIDLEHHDTHSYVGIVSLMQISTRDRDWIIDTLKPWRRKLSVLNEVFADPNIVKILHGAHMDIIWLQRDFGLYVVGLFDTYHASRVLSYAGGSLAFLLKKFVDFDAQKQYQTADWRLRPLPQEMLEYARSDTHFLLYVYDCMRNDLVERSDFQSPEGDLVQLVLDKSKETALQIYEHPFYDYEQGLGKGGWFTLLQKNMSALSKEQFAVFRKLHRWRDIVARQEDEGINTVMANHVLLNIARTLPRDIAGLLNCSHPISQTVRLRSSEVLDLMRSTLMTATTEPTLGEKLAEIMQARPGLGRRAGIVPSPAAAVAVISGPRASPSRTVGAFDGDIRSSSSLFWGTTVSVTDFQMALPGELANSVMRMVLPIPSYSSHVFTAGCDGITGDIDMGEESAPLDHGTSPNPPLEAGSHLGKRKHETSGDDAVAAATTASLLPSTGVSEQPLDEATTAARLAAKRVRKELKKQAKTAQSAVNREPSAESFDYDAAASVLHATRPSHGHAQAARPFNPYANSANAPQGARKKPEAQGSRSGTFKR